MYCQNCGIILANDVNFCPNCGTSKHQQNINVTISKKKEKHFEKNILGVKITKEVVGLYLLWLTLHFILFLIGINSFLLRSGFWPFTSSIDSYDYFELIVYSILPCVIYLVVNIFKRPEEEWEIDPKTKIRIWPLIVGLS